MISSANFITYNLSHCKFTFLTRYFIFPGYDDKHHGHYLRIYLVLCISANKFTKGKLYGMCVRLAYEVKIHRRIEVYNIITGACTNTAGTLTQI